MEPPVNNQQLAQQIYNRIVDYNDTEITDNDWNPVEDRLFSCTVAWFRGWIAGKIADNATGWGVNPWHDTPEDTAREWIRAVEPNVPKDARTFPQAPNNCFLGSNLINGPVRTYTITSLQTWIRTVYDIGNQANSHNQCYLIAMGDGNVVNGVPNNLILLCHTTHYAYPLRINGAAPQNQQYQSYQHSYDDLMASVGNQLSSVTHYLIGYFFTNQMDPFLEVMGKPEQRIRLFTLLTANYICESNRNWVHLLICLLDFTYERPICEDYQDTSKCHFVMRGGSWANKWSWGGGMNPHRVGNPNVADGRKIKRSLLKWVIWHSLNVAVSEDIWLWWIKIHLDHPNYEPTGGPIGDKLKEKLNQLFLN